MPTAELGGKIFVKIGIAFDPEKRLKQLQTGSPYPLIQIRPPLGFADRKEAFAFEAWAHRTAESLGGKIGSNGGKEFFLVHPKILQLFARQYRKSQGRKPVRVFIPKTVRAFLGFWVFIWFGILQILKPWILFTDFISANFRAITGKTPIGWFFSYLSVDSHVG